MLYEVITDVAEQGPGEHPHRYERQQLDDGFERHGEHQAVVVFRNVDLAGSEQDGKNSQRCSEHESGVIFGSTRRRVIGNDVEAGDDGLQLQGDVGDRTDRRITSYNVCYTKLLRR